MLPSSLPLAGRLVGWGFLLAAIVFEVGGTLSMKLSHGFARPLPSVLMFVFYGLCLGALTLAMDRIALHVVYAVWSGIGMALIAIIGIVWFREPLTGIKLLSFALILLGVVLLNLSPGQAS